MPFADQRQFLVYVEGITGPFARLQGGDKSAPSANAYDGGNPEPQVVVGNTQIGNVTVSRAFDPNRDGSVLASLKAQVGRFRTTITQVYTDADFGPVGGSDQWTGVLVKVTGPQLDAQKTGAQTAELTLEFACQTLR